MVKVHNYFQINVTNKYNNGIKKCYKLKHFIYRWPSFQIGYKKTENKWEEFINQIPKIILIFYQAIQKQNKFMKSLQGIQHIVKL